MIGFILSYIQDLFGNLYNMYYFHNQGHAILISNPNIAEGHGQDQTVYAKIDTDSNKQLSKFSIIFKKIS